MAKQTISTEAQNLHQENIVVDLHIDPIIQQALFGYHLSEAHDPNWKPPKRRWFFDLVQRFTKLKKAAQPYFNHITFQGCSKAATPLGRLGFTLRLLELISLGDDSKTLKLFSRSN